MRTELCDKTFISGFDAEVDLAKCLINLDKCKILFSGKTLDITEELATSILPLHPYALNDYKCYFEYNNPELELYNPLKTVSNNPNKNRNDYVWKWNDSILSACPNEYCVIYKTI